MFDYSFLLSIMSVTPSPFKSLIQHNLVEHDRLSLLCD